MALVQDRPKYRYMTVPRGQGTRHRSYQKKTGSLAEVAHWGVGALAWAINQHKISQEMEVLAPQIEQMMTTDGGVMVAHFYKRAPELSGNADKPIFTGAAIVGAGCTAAEVAAQWRARLEGPQIRPYYGKGWTTEDHLIWITMSDH
ncbi:hypothetical protein [Ruegeria jejuensis]|uniref:hypothetical protein n=1 Tax=Ruegeria jejuensis TaxID=3233338 RepID=UPI00355B1F57